MSATVDERIVAAKFDSSEFEKGADKVIKKLDELKKSLDLKDATNNIEELAEKTEASTSSMSNSVEKLTDRLTTFTGMVKQKILSGLADEVANVFLKMEQGVKGFIKSISSDQVSAGMSKYEQMLTSVRVLMSAGKSEEKSYEAIERLQTYSDETSYSLTQMTDAMSKMVAAGVGLEDATKNVEGIANACANAGINATDASRAFYNLSQAYSTGTLKYTDYRSLELLNLTTSEFKQSMLDAAEAAGTLEKVSDGVYKTINKNDKKVKAGKKVTIKNLSEMLKYDFMNTEAMNQLFGGTYWMEVIGREEYEKTKKQFKELYGDNWEAELKKKYGEVAVTAFEAAKEARSFTDVINAIKDAVSTGWSTTFQHLFGKLSEAKEFFTDLANSGLADVIYKIGEYRNAILGYWNTLDAAGRGAGGEAFRLSILNIAEALGTLFRTFQQILPGFDELEEDEENQTTLKSLGEKLKDTSMAIHDFTVRIKDAANEFNKWMNSSSLKGGKTRIELLREAFVNIGSVIAIFGKVIEVAFVTAAKVIDTLSPILDGVIDLFNKLTAPLTEIKSDSYIFESVTRGVDNLLAVLKPVCKVLGDILGFVGDIAAFIVSMALDTFISNITLVADLISLIGEVLTGKAADNWEKGEGVIGNIKKDFEGIKTACQDGLNALNEFFAALIGDVRKLLGLTGEDQTDQNGGIFSGIINFFNTNQFVQDAKKWVNQAINDIGAFILGLPERIKRFGANIFQTLFDAFFTVEGKYKDGKLQSSYVLKPLGEWLDNLIKDIRDFVVSLPDKIIAGIKTIGSWIDLVFKAIMGEPDSTKNPEGTEEAKDETMKRFDAFVESVKTSIKEWIEDLPNKIKSALTGVGGFFSKLIEAIDEFLFGKKQKTVVKNVDVNGKTTITKITTRYKTGFSKWLDQAIKEIKKFIGKIPEYIKAGIKGAGDIIQVILNALFGKGENEKAADSKDIEDQLKKPFLGINLSSILETIKDIGRTLLNEIARIFTGTDDVEANEKWFSEKVAEGINWIKTKADEALPKVLEFLGSIPTKIANIFKGENTGDQSPIEKAISGFGESVGTFIAGIPGMLLDFINNAVAAIDVVWDDFYTKIIGAPNESRGKHNRAEGEAKTGWELFVEKLGKTISNAFIELPVWVAEGINVAIKGIQEAIDGITNWFKQANLADSISALSGEIKNGTTNMVEGAEEAVADSSDESNPLWKAIKELGVSIFNLITTTIPTMVSEAWKWIGTRSSEIWAGLSGIFSGQKPNSELGIAVYNAGSTIVQYVEKNILPWFSNIWTWVSTKTSDIWEGISALFGGEAPTSSLGIAVYNAGMTIVKYVQTNILPWFSNIWKYVSVKVSDIWEGVSALFGGEEPTSSLGIAVKNAGETIVNFFFKELPDKISEIWSKIREKSNLLWQGVNTLFSKPAPDDKLDTAATQAGNTILKFFTETIPQKLSTMWTEISSLVDDIWNGVGFLFTGEIPKSQRGIAIANISSAIKNFLINDLPKALSDIWNSITIPKGKRVGDSLNDVMNIDPDTGKKVSGAVVKDFKKINKDVKDETSKPGFWDFLSDIGPSILEGIKKVLDFLSNIGDFVAGLFKGDDSLADHIEKAYGEEKPELRKALTNVGESIRRFFLETIPELIGSAIGAISKMAPKWFETLFAAIGKAAVDSTEDGQTNMTLETAVESGFDAMGMIFGVLQRLWEGLTKWVGDNSQFLQIMAVIVTVSMLFSRLADLFSISDELEEGANIVKWGAIAIAVAGLSGLISLIGEVTKPGNEAQLEAFKDVLKQLGDVLGTLAWIVGLMSVGKIADALDTKFGSTTGKVGLGEKFLGGLADSITGFFKAIGFGAGFTVATDLASSGIDTFVTTVSDSITTFTSGMATTGDLLTPFIEQMSSLDGKLGTAIGAVEQIKTLFSTFFNVFNDLYLETIGPDTTGDNTINYNNVKRMYKDKDETLLDNFDAQKEFLEMLSERMDIFIKLSTFIDNLASAASRLGSIDDLKTKLSDIEQVIDSGDFTTYLLKLLNSLNEAWSKSDISAKSLGSTQYIANARNSGVAIAIDMLASSMKAFADGISGLSPATVEGFEKALDAFVKLSNMVDEVKGELGGQSSLSKIFTGDKTLSKMGSEIKMFGYYISSFYDYIKDIPGFKESEEAETNRKIDSITSLARQFALAMQDMLKFGSSSQLIEDLGSKLPGFGSAVAEYFNNLNTALDTGKHGLTSDRASILMSATESVANMLGSLKDFYNLLSTHNNESISTILDKIFGNGVEGQANTTNASRLASIFATFDKAIVEVMQNKEYADTYTEIGSTMAKYIYEGVQSAFNTDESLTLKLKPELDMTAIQETLSNDYGIDVANDINWGDLLRSALGANDQKDKAQIDYTSNIDAVATAVNNMAANSAHASDIARAVSGIKVYLSTGELVGALTPSIDAEIGERIWYVQNNIALGP